MSRVKKVPLRPIETATTNGIEKQYVRLGATFLEHPAVLNLKSATFRVLILMIKASAGKSRFTFRRSYYEKHCKLSDRTVIRAVDELEKKGFLKVTHEPYSGSRPNVYEWLNDWKKRES